MNLLHRLQSVNKETVILVVLRITLGWYMFFAGLEKVLNPKWTAVGFLKSAETFSSFYAWFALPANSWWVDPLNAWGILLVGIALLLGVGLRVAGIAGAVLMILYYFPHVAFPYTAHGYIVEEHIIYATALLLIAFAPTAEQFGLARFLRKTFLGNIPIVGKLI